MEYLLFHNMMASISSLRKDRRGAAALEFAVVAPALFLLLVGFIEIGVILFAQTALEGGATAGSRIGRVNFTEGAVDRETYIRQRIEALSGGFLDPALLDIDILAYNDFSTIGQPEPCISPPVPPCPGAPGANFLDVNGNGSFDQDQGRASAGGSGAVVLYRVTYPWQVSTPLLGTIIGDANGVFLITAVSAIRNEAF